MRRRAAFCLAWSLAGISLAMFVAGFVFALLTLNVAEPMVLPSSDWGTGRAIGELLVFLPFLAFPIVGALIASRCPRNPIGWICLIAGLFWMLIVMNDQSTAYSLARTHVHPYQEERVEVVSGALDFRARPARLAPCLPRSLPPVRHRGVK